MPGHDDELYTKGAEEMGNMSLCGTSQDDAGTSLVLLDDRLKSIPDHLIEKILTMVPFPELGKARVLSKSWQARFLPIECHNDDEKKRLAISFQKQVSERCINWRPPCPIVIDLSEQRCFAYESASHNWPKMYSLSFLPAAVTSAQKRMWSWYGPILINHSTFKLDERGHIKCLELVDGTLLLAVIEGEHPQNNSRNSSSDFVEHSPLKLYVANLFTQTWRQLPQAPVLRGYKPFVKLVSQPAFEKYKVIMFYHGSYGGYFFAQCYDSKSNSWRRSWYVYTSGKVGYPAHLDGVLYMKAGYGAHLLAFNVEEETFEQFQLVGVAGRRWSAINLVVCNGNLLMTVQDDDSPMTVQVLKIDRGTREAFEVARGPPAAVTLGRCTMISPECHSDGAASLCFRLYGEVDRSQRGRFGAGMILGHVEGYRTKLKGKMPNPGMVVYNMRTDAWHYAALPAKCWLHSSFQTNFNPFLAV